MQHRQGLFSLRGVYEAGWRPHLQLYRINTKFIKVQDFIICLFILATLTGTERKKVSDGVFGPRIY